MNLNYSIKMVNRQRITVTKNIQPLIKILQMSLHDLKEYIGKEYSENPILEIKEHNIQDEEVLDNNLIYNYDIDKVAEEIYYDSYKDKLEMLCLNEDTSAYNFIEEKKSLKEYLYEQLLVVDADKYTIMIAKYIIESLDSRGYLEISIEKLSEELKISIDNLEKGLKLVQSLEPYGIGARNVKECLLIQSINLNILNDNIQKIILEHLEDVAENKYEFIGKKLKISLREAKRYVDMIKKLEPKPSRGFYTGEDVSYIIPDAEIKNIDGEFLIIMNEEILPKLIINKTYKDILKNSKDSGINNYVKEKLNEAILLIKVIDYRKNILYKVLEYLICKQREFFEKGYLYIKPLTLREISDELDIPTSIIRITIKDKYVLTSYGTIKIKDLFASITTNNL